MNLLSLHHLTMLRAHPLELIDAAQAGGFEYCGIRLVAPTPADEVFDVVGNPSMVRQIQQRLQDTGVKVLDVEAIWLQPATDVAALAAALETGRSLGAMNVLVVGFDPDHDRLFHNFCSLCQLANSLDMAVALEFITYCSISTLDQALSLVQRSRQSNARLLIDALQFFRSGAEASQLASIDKALVPYAQICDGVRANPVTVEDRRREARTDRLLPGEGELPVAQLVQALPPGIPLSVEAPTLKLASLPFNEQAQRVGEATRKFLRGASPATDTR